jgi:putative transferase (TIGR04331 family)
MSFFLVTTSNKYEISKSNLKYLILGNWCLNYKDNRYKNKKILNYHWNDRKKLQVDFLKINELYEKALDDLSIFLNEFHNIKYSKKFWRIVIGLWLNYFIEVIFDRFEMLKVATNYSDSIFINNYIYDEPSYIPNNMSQFMSFVTSDNWNEYIYSKIIKKRFSKKIKFIFTKEKKNNFLKEVKKQDISIKKQIYTIFLKYLSIFKKNNYYFKNTYLSNYNLFKIF